MPTYMIENRRTGENFGVFGADSPDEALEKFARTQRSPYRDFAEMRREGGLLPGEMVATPIPVTPRVTP